MLLPSTKFQLNLLCFQSLLLQRVGHLNLKPKIISHKLIPGQNPQISNLSRKSHGEDATIWFLPQVINTLMVPNLSEMEMEIEPWKVGVLRNIWGKKALRMFCFQRVLMNLQGHYNLPARLCPRLKTQHTKPMFLYTGSQDTNSERPTDKPGMVLSRKKRNRYTPPTGEKQSFLSQEIGNMSRSIIYAVRGLAKMF